VKTPYFSARKLRTTHPKQLILPLAVAALAVGIVWSALPGPSAPAQAVAQQPYSWSPVGFDSELPTLALPVEAPAAVAPVVEPVVEVAAAPVSSSYSIGITAFGWQNELDACQWVLMDMVAEVPLPIVAAHNYCGGGVVLEMQPGDTVTLGGYGYDGTYVVTGSRDASAGGSAAEAVSGMDGDVVLQTCYWEDNGTLRLVSIRRV
jgi:hypothetical protein